MSRKKPEKVFMVSPAAGAPIYVIARHEKGARMIARQHDGSVRADTPIELVHESCAAQAINRGAQA